MFIGEYEHNVDAKGRVIMPAKLREDIGDKFIITKGLDGCLFAYSQTEWENFEEKLKALKELYINNDFETIKENRDIFSKLFNDEEEITRK